MSAGQIKGVIFLVALPFLSWMLISRGWQNMARPPQSAPAVLSAKAFARDYHNEGWLTVDGRWASEHAWVSPVPNSKYNDYTNVFVPVVPDDWKEGEAVHVIAVFSEPSRSAANAWPAAHLERRGPVTGTVAPDGVWDLDRMFSSLPLHDPLVVIYVGQAPSGDNGKFDFWFGVGIAGVWGTVVLIAIARRRAR